MATSQSEADISKKVAKYQSDISTLRTKKIKLKEELESVKQKQAAWVVTMSLKSGSVTYTPIDNSADYPGFVPNHPRVQTSTGPIDGPNTKHASYKIYTSSVASTKALSWDFTYDFENGDVLKEYWLSTARKTSPTKNVTKFVDDPTYATKTVAPLYLAPGGETFVKQIDKINAEISDLNTLINKDKKALEKYKQSISLVNTDGTLNVNPIADFKYNVGSVKEAYFSKSEDFAKTYSGIAENRPKVDGVPSGTGTSMPTAVTNAMQLWTNGKSNKGMIQTSTYLINQGITAITPTSGNFNAQKASGFQFHYNPGSVEMNYQGISGVDTNFEGLGLDKFNAIGATTGTAATIGFSVLINRMFDMKYYDPETEQLRKDLTTSDLYYPRQPSAAEQKDIYNKGTMYDIEYLLRTLIGFSSSVRMGRNSFVDGTSADFGWTTGIPVEIHLGKSLRYLCWIGSITVNHAIFNEHMVPIFSQVNIVANRIPDNAVPLTFPDGNPPSPSIGGDTLITNSADNLTFVPEGTAIPPNAGYVRSS